MSNVDRSLEFRAVMFDLFDGLKDNVLSCEPFTECESMEQLMVVLDGTGSMAPTLVTAAAMNGFSLDDFEQYGPKYLEDIMGLVNDWEQNRGDK